MNLRLLDAQHQQNEILTGKFIGTNSNNAVGKTHIFAKDAKVSDCSAHDCNGMNDCKGQGGCGENPGENECKGKGGCEVPLSDKTWPKARKRFEELMTKAGKKFGDPPPKKA